MIDECHRVPPRAATLRSSTAKEIDEFPPPHEIKSGVGDVGQVQCGKYYQNLSKVTVAKITYFETQATPP